jgi:hypothetical protein
LHWTAGRAWEYQIMLEPVFVLVEPQASRSLDADCLAAKRWDEDLGQFQAARGCLGFQILQDRSATASCPTKTLAPVRLNVRRNLVAEVEHATIKINVSPENARGLPHA